MNGRDVALLALLVGMVGAAAYQRWESGKSPRAKSLKRLEKAGYIRRDGDRIALQNNAKCILLERASRKYDIMTILRYSNEAVFAGMVEPCTSAELSERTGLSPSTVHRALSDMAAAGIVRGDEKGRARLAEDLNELAVVMGIEREPARLRSAHLLYKSSNVEIVAVPAGKPFEGQLTAFSVFDACGVPYDSPRDYYAIQNAPVDMCDVLVHAVVISVLERNPRDMSAAIMFYMRNRGFIDTLLLRSVARSLGVLRVWLDAESYVRGAAMVGDGRLFLPREEFSEKCRAYGIHPESYGSAGSLFRYMGRRLSRPVTAYILGGENMRMKGIKPSAKHCDILAPGVDEFAAILDAATQMGYHMLEPAKYTTDDMRLYPDGILVYGARSRLNMFTGAISRVAVLTDGIREAADYVRCGALTLGVLSNEHVFLLKAMSGRDGDIFDMAALVRGLSALPGVRYAFDWDVVRDEVMRQEAANPLGCPTETAFNQISDMADYAGLEVPIVKWLRTHVVDRRILEYARGGWCPLSWVVGVIRGGDISEKDVRNRVYSLLKRGILYRKAHGRTVLLCGAERFPMPGWEISGSTVSEYLRWRFPHQYAASSDDAADLAGRLMSKGFRSMGDVDAGVAERLPRMPPPDHMNPPNAIDAARRCVG